MISKIWRTRYLTLNLILAFVAVAAQFVLPSVEGQEPAPSPQTTRQKPLLELTVSGAVKVNGQPAATGDIFSSGGTIETAKGSSAVVSLGKLGRVEVLPGSSLKLILTDSKITVSVQAGGSVRVGPASLVSGMIMNGQILADGPGKTEFTVDTSCGNTAVFVRTGRVDVRDFRLKKTIRVHTQHTIGQGRAGCVASGND